MKWLTQIAMLILWGFCICIGFWLGRKFTDWVDKGFNSITENRDGKKALKKAEKELAASASSQPMFDDRIEIRKDSCIPA